MGKEPDEVLALEWGWGIGTIRQRRIQLGIKRFSTRQPKLRLTKGQRLKMAIQTQELIKSQAEIAIQDAEERFFLAEKKLCDLEIELKDLRKRDGLRRRRNA